jgi:hypothetical protein
MISDDFRNEWFGATSRLVENQRAGNSMVLERKTSSDSVVLRMESENATVWGGGLPAL